MNRKERKHAAKLRRLKRRRRFTFEEAVQRAIGGQLMYREGSAIRISCHAGMAVVVDPTAPKPLMTFIRRYSPTLDDMEATDWRLEPPARL